MKFLISLLIVLTMSAFATGCSIQPTMKQLAEDSANASQVRAKADQERREQEQKRLEVSLSQIPSWVLDTPHPDATGIYAVGMGDSDTVRVAMHKATLDAEFGLAKIYGQELSGSERKITQDSNARTTNAQYTELIDKLVSQVPVVGFEMVHQDVKAIDGKYHAFILLKLPYEKFNSVLKKQAATANDANTEKQFADLERRLEKRRQQRIEEAAQKSEPGSQTDAKHVANGASAIAPANVEQDAAKN